MQLVTSRQLAKELRRETHGDATPEAECTHAQSRLVSIRAALSSDWHEVVAEEHPTNYDSGQEFRGEASPAPP